MVRTMTLAAVWSVSACSAWAQQCVDPSVLESVFVVGVRHADGSFTNVGTAWTIDRGWLATNAHVAEGLEEAMTGDGDRLVALRGVLDQSEVAIGQMRIHPAYQNWNHRLGRMLTSEAAQLKSFDVIAVADVALLEVVAGDPGRPLEVARAADPVHEPCLGAEVVYVGFPAENLSGFTTLHTVPLRVTAKTDFFFQRTNWADALLLHLTGAVAGGASGSPVLDGQGRVIGVLSAAEHVLSADETRVSFGFAYAQRADLATELVDGSVERNQAERDRAWMRRAADVFVDPNDLIDRLVRARASRSGFDAREVQVVARTSERLSDGRREIPMRVVMEPGFYYGFFAVAHDATDVDMVVTTGAGDELGSDRATDQYPVVWLDPVTERTEARATVSAFETLIMETPLTARVVRYPAELEPAPEGTFDERLVTIEQDGAHVVPFTYELNAGEFYLFKATSDQQRDIDLRLYRGEELIDSDVLVDYYPIVSTSGVSGEVRLELVLPATTVRGDTVRLEVTHEEAVGLDEAPAGEEFVRAEHAVDRAGTHTVSWTFTLEAGRSYLFRADSREGRDIDLRLYQGSTLLDSDLLLDSFPIVEVSEVGGEVRLELTLPADSVVGDVVDLVGTVGG